MKAVSTILGMMLFALAGATQASAGACDAQIQEHCADKKAGVEIMTCLRSQEDELSSECKAYLGFFENIPSCVGDADKLCGNPSSGAAVIACLRGRQTDLSNDCKAELRNIR